MKVWLTAMLKGGARKTTTTMFLAFALAYDHNVLVVDADMGTQGVMDWSGSFYADNPNLSLPFDVVQYSRGEGHLWPYVQRVAREHESTLVIIDSGSEDPLTVREAARRANLVISPVGPDQAELGRVEPTVTTIRAVAPDVAHVCLLTRVPVVGAGVALAAREQLRAWGYRVLSSEVPHHRALYESVWGSVPEELGAYAAVAGELETTLAGVAL